MLRPDPDDNELTLVAVHPGVEVRDVQDQTQWPLRVASSLEVTDAPTAEELGGSPGPQEPFLGKAWQAAPAMSS